MPRSVHLYSFVSIQDEWDQLLLQCPNASVFLTPQWQRTWWRQFGQDAELYLLTLRSGGRITGLAPLMRRDNVLSFLGDTDLFDYHDFIYPPESEASFFPALVEQLEREPWELLDMRSLPGESATLQYLPALFKERGYMVSLEQEDVAPRLALPATWEEYLAGLRKKDRHELQRKFRRMDKAGSYRHVHAEGGNLDEAMTEFFVLMRDSNHEKSAFMTPEREQFFREVVKEMAAAGFLSLSFLEMEGQPVAAVICFDYTNGRLLYNSGYNSAYSALSVGLLLKALCVQEAIERGMSYFDFLRGTEPYKYHLGAQDVPLHRLLIQRA